MEFKETKIQVVMFVFFVVGVFLEWLALISDERRNNSWSWWQLFLYAIGKGALVCFLLGVVAYGVWNYLGPCFFLDFFMEEGMELEFAKLFC